MAIVHGAEVVAKILKDEGVKYFFAVHGGHSWSLLHAVYKQGIQVIHMRHEQTCAYAADGWARVTGQPGVFSATAGPGMTNSVSGIVQAYNARSPVIALPSQHPTIEDHKGSLQEAYGAELCRTVTKMAQRITDWTTIAYYVQRAFREALAPPPGPALVEFPVDILFQRNEETLQRRLPPQLSRTEARAQGDPVLIEKAVRMLLGAEKPLILASDGIFWSGAASELKEFVELTNIPVYTRRMGLGAVPEEHPLAVRAAYKKQLAVQCDVILAIGFRFWWGEGFGQPPSWNPETKFIQVDANPTEIGFHIPVTLGIVGDPKAVLQQMIDCARELIKEGRKELSWLETVRQIRAAAEERQRAEEQEYHHAKPIHPHRLSKEIVDFLDKDATVIYDSFTGSGYLTDWFRANFIGQVLDAGPIAGIGHSIGMAIAAQLARPGKQVFVMLGDGGIGIAGMDIETALRYKLPIVYLVYNNSSWMGPAPRRLLFGDDMPNWDMLPNIRYDKMFEAVGCHSEHVEDPEEIRPALERAFNSGKTSVVNVIVDREAMHPMLGSPLLGQFLLWYPYEKMTDFAKKLAEPVFRMVGLLK
jgi:acetolactate synthase-1/2/3 large subunit